MDSRQLTSHGGARSKLLVMENQPDRNLFREVHRKVQEVKDRARKIHDEVAQRHERIAEVEAQKEHFDRPASIPPSENRSK